MDLLEEEAQEYRDCYNRIGLHRVRGSGQPSKNHRDELFEVVESKQLFSDSLEKFLGLLPRFAIFVSDRDDDFREKVLEEALEALEVKLSVIKMKLVLKERVDCLEPFLPCTGNALEL